MRTESDESPTRWSRAGVMSTSRAAVAHSSPRGLFDHPFRPLRRSCPEQKSTLESIGISIEILRGIGSTQALPRSRLEPTFLNSLACTCSCSRSCILSYGAAASAVGRVFVAVSLSLCLCLSWALGISKVTSRVLASLAVRALRIVTPASSFTLPFFVSDTFTRRRP